MPSDFQKFFKKIPFYFLRLKSEREREREKRKKEKDEKLAKLAKLDQLEKKKESGRTASALSVLLPFHRFCSCTRSDCNIYISIIIRILIYIEVVRHPPIQEIGIHFSFYHYIYIYPSYIKVI